MTKHVRTIFSAAALAAVLTFAPNTAAAKDKPAEHWVGTWEAGSARPLAALGRIDNQTIREIVRATMAGTSVRVHLSNAFGAKPLNIGSAHIAIRSSESAIAPASDRALTFSGQSSIAIPPGALVVSDPVQLNVPAGGDLAISVYIPGSTVPETVHSSALQTCYLGTGDLTGSAAFPPDAMKITSWPFLSGVSVSAPENSAAIVAIGDSITDGAHSTVDKNSRWPDALARRLAASGRKQPLAVLNAGIGGNRILHDGQGPSGPAFGPNALARFERDVLAQPGVKFVIVLEGINDIGQPGTTSAPMSEEVSAQDIIAGLRQMVERAHEKGLRIFGGTLVPFGDTTIAGYYSPEREKKRQAVNEWIRTGKAFDGVIDFEKAVRDPNNPMRLLPKYDSGDHLHPSDAGYQAMGEAIDLSLFK